MLHFALFPDRQAIQLMHVDDLVAQHMVIHHLAADVLAQLGKPGHLGILGIGGLELLLQRLQLSLLAPVPAALEVVAELRQFDQINGQRRAGRQGRQQGIELLLKRLLYILDGHLHGVELGQVQQVAVDIVQQGLGVGTIGRIRIVAHLAHEAVQVARQLVEALLYIAIIGFLAPQQINSVGIDPIEDQFRCHTQLGGLVLLAEQLPAIAGKRQQRDDDQAQDNTIDPCHIIHPVSILMS